MLLLCVLSDAVKNVVIIPRDDAVITCQLPVQFGIVGINQQRPALQLGNLRFGRDDINTIQTYGADDRRGELLVTAAEDMALATDGSHYQAAGPGRAVDQLEQALFIRVYGQQLPVAQHIDAQ